jgi:hypothetical protein
MNLVEIKLDNTRRKSYRVNKNGYLYLYQDVLSDYILVAGDTYVVLAKNSMELLVVKYTAAKKTYSGIKLTKDTENIFHFNLRKFLNALNISFPCRCYVSIFEDTDYKGINVRFLCS